jgi:hypothetical protein
MQLRKRVFSWSEGGASSRQGGRRSFPQQAANKGERALAGLRGGTVRSQRAAEKLGRPIGSQVAVAITCRQTRSGGHDHKPVAVFG